MAGSTPTTIQTRFTANVVQMERELARMQRLNARAAANVANAHARAAAQSSAAWRNSNIGGAITQSLAGIGPQLKQYAGVIAGLFAGQGALNAAESYSRFSNSLKVAGLEGAALNQVQDALYQSAIKNGVALEPLGQLYSRAAQSAKELGASQQQLLAFTDGITSALRVSGTSTEQASGALMQLSQALAGGVIHAEEFNSINEGARPILEAVARGNEKYGGSVAKLRKVMLDGKLSSREFFNDFLAGAASLEAQAAKAPLTVAAAMTNLHTALTRYIGEANETWSVSQKITHAINVLASNMDVLAKSVAIVGAAYAATFIPALGRAAAGLAVSTAATVRSTAASIADTVALIARTAALHRVSTASATAAVATRALGGALAFFGGPLGLAIMGVAAAVGYLGVTSAKAALEAQNLSDRVDQQYEAFEAARKAAADKRNTTGQMTAAEITAATKTAALTGELHKIKDAYWMAAAAAKAYALETARANASAALKTRDEARRAFDSRIDQEMQAERRRGLPAERGLGVDRPVTQAQTIAAKRRAFLSPEGQTWARSVRNAYDTAREVETTRNRGLEDYTAAPVGGDAGNGKPKKTGSGAKPKDPTNASEDAIRAAEREYAAALAASAKTAEERHAYALAGLEADRADSVRDIERRVKEGDITKAAGEKAKLLIENTYQQKRLNEQSSFADELATRENEITEQAMQLRTEGLNLEADRLSATADATKDLRKRHAYERQALTMRQKADDDAFKVQQDLLALDRLKRGYTQMQVDQLRREAEANREKQKSNERGELDQRQIDETPKNVAGQISDYAESFGSLNDQLSNIAKNGIDSITNGLTEALMGTKSLKEAFSDMAKSIISQLIQMAVRFAIFSAIGAAFGMPGLGRAAIGMPVAKNAKGTDNFGGGLTWVGENGPELMAAPRGTQIMPNNLLRNLALPAGGAGQQSVVNNITTNVEASDAVLTSWVKDQVAGGVATAVQTASKVTQNALQKQAQNRLGR